MLEEPQAGTPPSNSELLTSNSRRRLAAELFNRVWTLLEKPDRDQADDDTMLHAAHASRFHWGEVGEPVNFARGEWQVSRVYATLGRPEPARFHAQRCLDICLELGIGDFDLAFAYEALARAAAVAGQPDERDRYVERAKQAGAQIAEADERENFFNDLATIPT
jgi:hypothetical protein